MFVLVSVFLFASLFLAVTGIALVKYSLVGENPSMLHPAIVRKTAACVLMNTPPPPFHTLPLAPNGSFPRGRTQQRAWNGQNKWAHRTNDEQKLLCRIKVEQEPHQLHSPPARRRHDYVRVI